MAFGSTYCGKVLVSMFIAMAFSMPLLHSSHPHTECAGFLSGTRPPVAEIAAPSTQRRQSDSDGAPKFGEGAADDSERKVPTGPDPLHHHFDPEVRP